MANSVSFLRVLSIWWLLCSRGFRPLCSLRICLLCSIVRSGEESWWSWYKETAEPQPQVGAVWGEPSHTSLPQHLEMSPTSVPAPAASGLHQPAAEEGVEHSTAAPSPQVRKASPDGSHKVHFQMPVYRYWNAPSALKWFLNCTQWKALVSLIGRYGRGKKKSHRRKSKVGKLHLIAALSKAELLHYTAQRL